MEKKFKSSDERSVGYGPAYVINSFTPDRLVGKVLSIIEAIGLSEKQENSVKNLIRQEIYNSLELTNWIPGQLNTLTKELCKWYDNMDKKIISSNTQNNKNENYMTGEFELSYKE